MLPLIDALKRFLPDAVLGAFAIASGVWAFAVILLDCISYHLLKKSWLRLKYDGIIKTVAIFILWTVAAALAALIGAAFGLFQTTLQASILAGVSWPSVMPRLLQKAADRQSEDEQTIE